VRGGRDPECQQDPERSDRLEEADLHRGPNQAQGGTRQGNRQVRQTSKTKGTHRGKSYLGPGGPPTERCGGARPRSGSQPRNCW
jgi:hypothetical protein